MSCLWFSPAVPHLCYSILPSLLPRSASCLQPQSLPSLSPSLPRSAPASRLITVLLLLCKAWAPLGGISALQSVLSPASTHAQGQTGIYAALRRAGAWAQSFNFPCLHSWQGKMWSKGSESCTIVQNNPGSCRVSLRLCHWVLSFVKEKEDAEEKALLCPCRPR